MNPNSLIDRIRAVMSLDPQRGAIEHRGRWTTYGELTAAVQAIDGLLEAAGLREGAVVGMVLRNRPSHFAAVLCALLTGRCVATINPFQGPEKLAEEVRKLRPGAIVADTQDWAASPLLAAAQEAGSLGIALGDGEGVEVGVPAGLPATMAPADAPRQPGVAILMLTSGTTGPAKRIPLAFDSLQRALMGALFYESGGESGAPRLRDAVVIATAPLVHIGGIWSPLSAMLAGRSFVLMEKFNVPEFHDAVKRHRPKVVPLPPSALRMVFDADLPRGDMASILAVRSGTAPLERALREAFEERYGIPVLDAYGATEFAGGVAGWTLQDYKVYRDAKAGSVGRAQPGCKLQVVAPEGGAVLPSGEIGLLEVRAPHIGDGSWVRTSDLARIDADGFLFLCGRADAAINRGGFKILPDEVAAVLARHPAVAEASVVGLPDPRLGEVPAAAVTLKPGAAEPAASELIQFARQHLTAYQVPVKVRVVAEMPRTPSMKISQPGVRELLLASE